MISIILPCRNEAGRIRACLASVLGQKCDIAPIEVIVADGMSTDGSREWLEQMAADGSARQVPSPRPILRVIDNPSRIVAAALNAAIREARGEIIVRMDAHTEYAPDYVQRCVETLQETGADNVGGPARTRADCYMERAVAAAFHSPFSAGGARFHDVHYEGPVDTVTYGCWRKGAFERFGYFDEELVRNQDDEHNLRILRGGGKVWQSSGIRSWYRPRGSLPALFRQYMQYGYWKVRVIQKHRLPASWRHLVPGTFVGMLSISSLLSALSILLSAGFPEADSPVLDCARLFLGSLTSLLAAYAIALTTASLLAARKSRLDLLPVLPLVFACYHFGYGCGFLRGVWDFMIRRQRPAPWATTLTRGQNCGRLR